MATLTNTKIKDTYDGLLKTTDNEALDVSGVTLIEDGLGNASALSVGRSGNGVSVSGLLDVSGEVQGTSLDINGAADISGNLAVDTNTLYVDAANNRVGVGTSSPDSQLEIESSTGGSIRLSSTDTTVADEAIGNIEFYSNDASSGGTGVKSYIKSVGGPFGQNYSLTFGTAGTGSVSEAMRIDSSGNVGINTSPVASRKLHIDGGSISADTPTVRISSNDSSGTNKFGIEFYSNSGADVRGKILADNNGRVYIDDNGGGGVVLQANGGSGNVGIGISDPNSYNASFDDLVLGGSSNHGITIKSGTSSLGQIAFADGTTGDEAYRGLLRYDHSADSFMFYTSGLNEKMRIDSSGNTYVNYSNTAVNSYGGGAYGGKSVIKASAANALCLMNESIGGSAQVVLNFTNEFASSQYNYLGRIIVEPEQSWTTNAATRDSRMSFFTTQNGSTTERMRITSSGDIQLVGNKYFYANPSAGSTTIGSGFNLDGSNNLMTLWTNNTERMRITSGGYLKVGRASTESRHLINNSANGNSILDLEHDTSLSSQPYGVNVDFRNVSPDNNTNWFHRGEDSTAVRFYIYSDGDVWTSDAGTLTSDETLKNNITDATPKLDDVMNLRVRNYYWNEDYHPEKTDKKLIGFVAQEFEQVFPHLVSEHIIKDEELAEDGTVIQEAIYKKGIKEGKLIPILVKAMQEQQEIINNLKARIETLEAK